tara:strand:+ start:124 stop:651 length:528 start_codon:yes stop_codon:yes gene_type:complete
MTDSIPDGFEPFPETDGFVAHVGPLYWAVREGRGYLGFRVDKRHVNPAGICHGGMMMTVMDMVIGFNVQLGLDRAVFVPSVQCTYDFLRPGKLGDWLEGSTDFVHLTRRTGFANGYLTGSEGPVVRCNGIAKIPGENNTQFRHTSKVMQLARERYLAQKSALQGELRGDKPGGLG